MKTATQEGPGTGPALDLVRVSGKIFIVGGRHFDIRGVTYGTFLPRADGQPFLPASDVQRDFASIRERGLNAVRTYHVPPPDVLEAAEAAGLRLLVGLEYRDWRLLEPGRRSRRAIRDAGRRAVEHQKRLDAFALRPRARELEEPLLAHVRPALPHCAATRPDRCRPRRAFRMIALTRLDLGG